MYPKPYKLVFLLFLSISHTVQNVRYQVNLTATLCQNTVLVGSQSVFTREGGMQSICYGHPRPTTGLKQCHLTIFVTDKND